MPRVKRSRLAPFLLAALMVPACDDGKKAAAPDIRPTLDYALPFPAGTTYHCTEGYVGRRYHKNQFLYGVDFAMAIGTPVTAARAGTVAHVEQRHSDLSEGLGTENLVVVRHGDGTLARYVHLMHKGARVAVGDVVRVGTLLGLSGNSGWSDYPHLHFDVVREPGSVTAQSLPIGFTNGSPDARVPVSGQDYTALPLTAK